MEKYQLGNLINSGNFGSVYKVKCKNTGKIYAMKILKYSKQLLIKRIPKFNRQLQSLEVLSHPNIIQFIETFEDEDNKVCIVMDYCSKGDLTKYITSPKTKLTNKQRLELFGQILEGMYYVQNQNYMHRDLKPDNIMLNEDGIAKIGDFGMIKKYQNDIIHSVAGTPLYASPQVLNQTGLYTKKCDVYSIGLILFFIVFQYDLFQEARKMQQLMKLQEQLTKEEPLKQFVANLTCDEDFKKIFLVTLCYQQAQRYSMQQLRDWFIKTIKPKPTFIKSQELILNSINSFFMRIFKQVNFYNEFVPLLKQLESDKSLRIKTIKRYSYILFIGCMLVVEKTKLRDAIKSEQLEDEDFNRIKQEWINKITNKINDYTQMCIRVIHRIQSKKGHKYLQQNPQIQKVIESFKAQKRPSGNYQYTQLLKDLFVKQMDNNDKYLVVENKLEFMKRMEELI